MHAGAARNFASNRRVCCERFEELARAVTVEAREPGDSILARLSNSLHAPEFLQQLTSLHGSDTRHFEQLRGDGPHRPPLAVIGNREAMRLVAGLLEESQPRRPPRNPQRLLSAPDEHLFVALGEADQRTVGQTRFAECCVRGRKLTFATVDHDEIGQRFLVLQPSLEVATNDLLYRREVIRALHGFHLEFAVLASLWPAVLEPHTRPHRICPLGSGNVEAHQRPWQALQPKLSAELVDRIAGTLVS